MTISDDLVRQAILQLSSVEGVFMDPDALVEDAVLLGVSFPDDEEYLAAVLSTCRALKHLAAGSVSSSELGKSLKGWHSYHYQHRVGQRMQADMRIEWQMRDERLYVRGFGHRWIPSDFYQRISADR